MQINVFLTGTGVSGGRRVIFEIANELVDRGHDVTFLCPIVSPDPVTHPLHPKKLRSQLQEAVDRIGWEPEVDWFDLEVDLRRIPALGLPSVGLDPFVPDADATVATSWRTARPVARLGPSKGTKFYLVQHYEIWPLWDSDGCWRAAEDGEGEPSLAMVDVVPDDDHLRRYKERVDATYELPLHTIVTSDWERAVMDRLGVDLVGSIPYGVDFDHFRPVVESSGFEILALYRNARHKGDEEAVEVFKQLHASRPDVTFTMFGPTRADAVPDFVEFHEDPSQETIRELYSRSDVLVYPSWVEGYGMPPMEAMACRSAVVSTDVGAVREYSPENGIRFVPTRDADAIVREVTDLLHHPEELERMKESCHDYIRQFTWERTTDEFLDILSRCVN